MSLQLDALVRSEGPFAVGGGRVPAARLAALVLAGGVAYGWVMGCHGGRPLQAAYSAIKVPILLGVTTALCLPSYYVANSILGLRADFPHALRGVLASQATLAVALASLAPLMGVVYLSIENYPLATLYNASCFAIATGAGQAVLARHYRPLVLRNPRHRRARALWLALYVFVAIQMAWVLRPFLGSPGLPTRFLREDAWSNAYVQVARVMEQALRGR